MRDTTDSGWADGNDLPRIADPLDASNPAGLMTGSIDTRVSNVATPVWDEWREQLSLLGGDNPLLHFPREPRIELSTGHPGGLARFFSGNPTFLRNLVRDDVALHRAKNSAILISDKNVELAAARGIDSVHLAVGTVEWSNRGQSFCAPMLIRPVAMHRRGDDVELQLRGSLTLNPALVRELHEQFGIALDDRTFVALTNDNGSFRPNGALDRLRGLIAHLDDVSVTPTLAVANLSDVAFEMSSAAEFLDHPILDVLGGNNNAQRFVHESHSAVDPGHPDTRSLDTDRLILDADQEQERIVAHIVAGNSVVVATPAGTGTTQTIVNAIGELVRTGKSVLVVGPRRARLEAIRRRFRDLSLDGIGVSPSSIKSDLIRSISRIEKTATPATTNVDAALERMRTVLLEYRTALSDPDPRFGVSVLDAIRELTRLSNSGLALNEIALEPETVVAVTAGMDDAIDALMEIAELGQFDPSSIDSAWRDANFTAADDAATALASASRLEGVSLPSLESLAAEILGPTPLGIGVSVDDVRVRVELLNGIAETLDKFTPELFDRSIGDFVIAYSPKTVGDKTPALARRRLKKLAKEFVRPGAHISDMVGSLRRADEQRAQWSAMVNAAYRPSVPSGITSLATLLPEVLSDIGTLNRAFDRRLDQMPFSDLATFAASLAKDADGIDTIHERSSRTDSIRAKGLAPLLSAFAGRIVTREIVESELKLAWWRGVLEAIIADRQQLLGADTSILDRLENDFTLVDRAHITGNSHKTAHALAEAWRIAVRDLPDEVAGLRLALKGGHATVDRLSDVAPTLVDVLAPVWCVSPYSVKSLAKGQSFDVVMLVDAAAMSEAEAAPAIARGGQIVAFGDPVTDQPTPFTITPGAPDGSDGAWASILDALAARLPALTLTTSYRPLGTSLAAQISTHLYSGAVSSWPLAESSIGGSGLTFIGVDGAAPLNERTGRIEGVQSEVDAVVANVIEHATLHSDETLMVVSASAVTSSRIQEAIQAILPANRTLQDFFGRHDDEPFIVVTLNQASAITRDRVIFSVGFGRSPHGRVLSDLGALSLSNGPRLVAIAMTRATHHLTVVSCLTTAELREARMSAGARALGEFIDDTLAHVPAPTAHHPLLDDLGRRLERRGLVLLADVPGVPLAARSGDECVAIDIDDSVMNFSLREGLRIRPAMLARCGWTYERVHELELFLSPDFVADRIIKALRGGQDPA